MAAPPVTDSPVRFIGDHPAHLPRMVVSWREAAWLVLFVGLLIGGCNVFDGLTAGPNTVDELLTDARTALAGGNPARAVQLLEQAFEKDSSDVRVRIELGNALYSERGLDVFVLRAAVDHLVAPSDSSTSSTAGAASSGMDVCTAGDRPDPATERYVRIPMEAVPFRRLSERTAVVERVRRLVVEGVFSRRSESLEEAGVSVRRKGFLVGAITKAVTGVIGVRENFIDQESTLLLDREAQPHRALVACARGEDVLARSQAALCTLSDATQSSIQWLQARNRLSESGAEGAVLIAPMRDLVDAARLRTGCPESDPSSPRRRTDVWSTVRDAS